MTHWRPKPSPQRFLLVVADLLCMGLVLWVWGGLSSRAAQAGFDPPLYLLGLLFFLSLVLLGMLAYVTWCAFTLDYVLDERSLLVRSGGVSHLVPLSAVRGVHAPGDAVDLKSVVVRWRDVPPFLPGYVVAEGRSAQLGRLLSVANAPVHEQVLIATPGMTFGVSPADAKGFMAELDKQRKAAGPEARTAPSNIVVALSGPSAWGTALWGDTPARRLLLAGLLLNALFFGYMSLVYGGLPTRLALHWNAQAQVDRVGDPLELLRLPVFALTAWLVNAVIAWWALRRERAVSLFLLAGADAAQVVFWAGVLSIVLRAS